MSASDSTPLKITFLGTGTSHGIPVISCDCKVCTSQDPKDKRFRCSILVESPNTTLVVDAGPDFRMQMLHENVKMVDAILVTHEHRDHIAGIDDIRVFNYKKEGDLDFFAYKRVSDNIRETFSYIFAKEKYPGVPGIKLTDISDKPFEVGDIQVNPIEVIHYKMKVCAFRFGDFAYVTDVSDIPVESIEKLKGVKKLVLGALRKTPHMSHFSIYQAIEMSEKIGAEETYFVHMSHDMGLHEEVQKDLPKNMFLAYDGLELNAEG